MDTKTETDMENFEQSKAEAKRLIDKFWKFANGYAGSSMLTNTEFEDVRLSNTKRLVLAVTEEKMLTLGEHANLEYYRELQEAVLKFEFDK